ncbi:ferredoxin [Embleya sp. NPDC005575]|uniref:ferredoxin n=1 Tax=Embleya sp. NPDC005575 TaxID=3156892 RepID=UPI0033AE8FA6
MTYVIGANCVDVKDLTCVAECPVDCIFEGDRMLYIHPEQCVDCGACEPVCPVEAIYHVDDLPTDWLWHLDAATEATAGREDVEPVPDPAAVAALPARPTTG